ncbi:hypothetical protein SLE2022_019130 [Rubroshorea leprosula]
MWVRNSGFFVDFLIFLPKFPPASSHARSGSAAGNSENGDEFRVTPYNLNPRCNKRRERIPQMHKIMCSMKPAQMLKFTSFLPGI